MSEAGFDLSAFLAGQRSEGEQDSEGQFTVASEKALKKLAHFALPAQYSWVQKIVQAANMWNAETLEVAQSRIATSFYFCPQNYDELPTDSQIVNALNKGLLDDSPVDHLAMALRSLVEQVQLSFVLAVRRGATTEKPIFAGDDTSELSTDTREAWASMKREGVRLTVSHFSKSESQSGRYTPSFSGIERRDLKIATKLERTCFASKVPIVLDGRLVTSHYQPPERLSPLRYRPLLTLTSRESSDDWSPQPVSPLVSQEALHTKHLPPPDGSSFGALYGLEWRTLRKAIVGGYQLDFQFPTHKISWVRHGVIVKQKTFHNASTHMNLSLFLNANGLRSDLSGLAIKLDREDYQNGLQRLQPIFKKIEDYTASFPDFLNQWLTDVKIQEHETPRQASTAIRAAGYSVATESLGSLVQHAKQTISKAWAHVYEQMESHEARRELLQSWGDKTLSDLGPLANDMLESSRRAF